MSKRNNSTPNTLASCWVTSVLPTPVGPAKINEPIGLRSLPKPARDKRITEDSSSIA